MSEIESEQKKGVSVMRFIVEQGVIGITMGSIIGFGTTNFSKELRKYLFTPFLTFLSSVIRNSPLKSFTKQFPTTLREPVIHIFAALFELLLLLGIVAIIYQHTIIPLFKEEIKKQKKADKRQEEWREQILKEVSTIDKKFTMPYGV